MSVGEFSSGTISRPMGDVVHLVGQDLQLLGRIEVHLPDVWQHFPCCGKAMFLRDPAIFDCVSHDLLLAEQGHDKNDRHRDRWRLPRRKRDLSHISPVAGPDATFLSGSFAPGADFHRPGEAPVDRLGGLTDQCQRFLVLHSRIAVPGRLLLA